MQRYTLGFKGCTGLQDEPQGKAQGRCTVQRLVGESENLKRVTRIPNGYLELGVPSLSKFSFLLPSSVFLRMLGGENCKPFPAVFLNLEPEYAKT